MDYSKSNVITNSMVLQGNLPSPSEFLEPHEISDVFMIVDENFHINPTVICLSDSDEDVEILSVSNNSCPPIIYISDTDTISTGNDQISSVSNNGCPLTDNIIYISDNETNSSGNDQIIVIFDSDSDNTNNDKSHNKDMTRKVSNNVGREIVNTSSDSYDADVENNDSSSYSSLDSDDEYFLKMDEINNGFDVNDKIMDIRKLFNTEAEDSAVSHSDIETSSSQ